MDWRDYKALCDSPDVVSRWMLGQTLELLMLESAAAVPRRKLESALNGSPLAKPPDHRGGPATDMFHVRLSVEEARSVASLVARAAASGRTTSGTAGRGLGGFVEAWQELVDYLAGRPTSGSDVCSVQ